jgi:hypothetical protein
VRVCAGDGGGRDERGAGRTKSASTNTNQLHGPGTRSPSLVFRRQDIQIGSKILFKSLYITYQTGSRCPLQKLPSFCPYLRPVFGVTAGEERFTMADASKECAFSRG